MEANLLKSTPPNFYQTLARQAEQKMDTLSEAVLKVNFKSFKKVEDGYQDSILLYVKRTEIAKSITDLHPGYN